MASRPRLRLYPISILENRMKALSLKILAIITCPHVPNLWIHILTSTELAKISNIDGKKALIFGATLYLSRRARARTCSNLNFIICILIHYSLLNDLEHLIAFNFS